MPLAERNVLIVRMPNVRELVSEVVPPCDVFIVNV